MAKSIKSWLYLVAATLVLLSMAACDKTSQDEVKGENLQVSLTNVVFTKDGGTESVVISGVSEWSYLSNVGENDWLRPTKVNDKLTLTATPNMLGKERRAEVLISSRVGVQKVFVVQSASDIILSFSESELVFPHKESEKIVQVATNSESWSFEPVEESAKEWLQVIGGEGAKTIILKVTANKSYEERSTTLVAKASNGEQVGLKVTQKGVAKYLLPYQPTANKHNDMEIINFERERASVLQNWVIGYKDDHAEKEVPTELMFITNSKIMPLIKYKRDLDELKYTEALTVLLISDEVKQTELHEYHAFLTENGYVKSDDESTDLKWLYINEKAAMVAAITIEKDGASILFAPYYPQTKEYPTFPAVPVSGGNWLERLANTQYKAEDIIRLEKEAGSKVSFINKDDKNQLYISAGFDLPKSSDKYAPLAHNYWFYTKAPGNASDDYIQTVSEQAMYFSNPTWGIRVEGRRHFVTNEMKKLLSDAGYIYDGASEDGRIFYFWKPVDDTRELIIYLTLVKYTDINNGDPALMIGYYPIFLNQQTNGANAAATRQSTLRVASEGDIEAFDELITSPRIRAHKALMANRNRK